MSAQWTFDLTCWEESNRGYLIALAAKYCRFWQCDFDEAKSFIWEVLPDIAKSCKGNLTPAYVAQAVVNKRISLRRKEQNRNADIAHGGDNIEQYAEIASEPAKLGDDDGVVLTVSLKGELSLVTLYGGEIVSNVQMHNVGRVIIQAEENRIKVIDCE